jgi:hypothetical protein
MTQVCCDPPGFPPRGCYEPGECAF